MPDQGQRWGADRTGHAAAVERTGRRSDFVIADHAKDAAAALGAGVFIHDLLMAGAASNNFIELKA